MKREIELHLKKKIFENTGDVDMYIKDAFGVEHRIFPKEKKKLTILVRKKKL